MLLKKGCIPNSRSLDLAALQPGTEMFKLILHYANHSIKLEGMRALYYFSLFFRFIQAAFSLLSHNSTWKTRVQYGTVFIVVRAFVSIIRRYGWLWVSIIIIIRPNLTSYPSSLSFKLISSPFFIDSNLVVLKSFYRLDISGFPTYMVIGGRGDWLWDQIYNCICVYRNIGSFCPMICIYIGTPSYKRLPIVVPPTITTITTIITTTTTTTKTMIITAVQLIRSCQTRSYFSKSWITTTTPFQICCVMVGFVYGGG